MGQLWWNGNDADLFVGTNRATENLLNGCLEPPGHLTGFLNGDVLHRMLPHF
jgi:hypothetical protein